MPTRHLPVRPNLDQLKHQAKDLLRGNRRGDPSAIEELHEHHPGRVEPGVAKLADAQLALAHGYTVASWPRLVLACRVIDAIWRDDVAALRRIMVKHPQLLHEMASGRAHSNWGPPMSYAANLGRDRIIAMLRDLGAADLQHALNRAILQGRIETARKLYAMGARPPVDAMMGPAETQNGPGLAYLLELGVPIGDADGDRLAPPCVLLETYCRNPEGKHQCLELFASHGIDLPDTPAMAFHRGRIDLLEEHLPRPGTAGPDVLASGDLPARAGVPCRRIAGAARDAAGGRHAAAHVRRFRRDGDRAVADRTRHGRGREGRDRCGRLRRAHGAVRVRGDAVGPPQARRPRPAAAGPRRRSQRPRLAAEALRFVADESMREYRDVTPMAWGQQFHDPLFVNPSAMR